MLVSGFLGMMVFVTYPVAPPRLFDLGLVDTVTESSEAYRYLQPPAFVNQYAAMPSLHAGWDLLVGLAILGAAATVGFKAVGVLMPVLMMWAVVATANHFVLDVVAGLVLALIGHAVALHLERHRANNRAERGCGEPMTVLAIAHRAGNSLAGLAAANDLGVDVIECDVHDHRGRLEVRHLKTAGPLPFLWDRWELVSAAAPRLGLAELLAADRHGTTFMLDLKGRRPTTGRAVAELLHEVGHARPLLACGRWWPAVDGLAETWTSCALCSRLAHAASSSACDDAWSRARSVRRLGARVAPRHRCGGRASRSGRARADLAGQRPGRPRNRARVRRQRRHQRRRRHPRPGRGSPGPPGHRVRSPGLLVPPTQHAQAAKGGPTARARLLHRNQYRPAYPRCAGHSRLIVDPERVAEIITNVAVMADGRLRTGFVTLVGGRQRGAALDAPPDGCHRHAEWSTRQGRKPLPVPDAVPEAGREGGIIMHAHKGDRIVVRNQHVDGPVRDGEIVAVEHQDGSPPYRVRWSDNGHESLFFPGPDSYIDHGDVPAPSAPDNG